MTYRLYTNEEVENISETINEVDELTNGLFEDIIFYTNETQLTFDDLKKRVKNKYTKHKTTT